ncbi:STAS domain-containing protein [Cryptosporangium sp. NPDC051539]|uniref:STAS domain-containing protein n=1 Tax=Cryptosporangium sp. NPDC051539 TaxID=3363962 RepID=UPI0037A8E280
MDAPRSPRDPRDPSLTITMTQTAVEEMRLAVTGELSRTTSGQLIDAVDHALAAVQPRTIQVDLAELSDIDAGGLRIVGLARQRCAAADCRLQLRNARPAVLRLLRIAGQWHETTDTQNSSATIERHAALTRQLAHDRRMMTIHVNNAAALHASAQESTDRAHAMRRYNAALRARVAARRRRGPGSDGSAG